MKKILKLFGLPRTGTNVTHYLLALNFKNYVSTYCQHTQHYLGWKHGLPKRTCTYEKIELLTEEEICFVFTLRNFKEWEDAILEKHFQCSWEFPPQFKSRSPLVYMTPNGPEIYNNFCHLHSSYELAYKTFALENDSRCYLLDFKNLKTPEGQKSEMTKIYNKFSLDKNYDVFLPMLKKIDEAGTVLDAL